MADLITIDRAVVQQALDALEDVDGPITALLGGFLGSPDADAPGAKVRASITALRAALAQAEPVEVAQKSGEFRVMVCGVDCHPGDQHCNGYCTGKTDDPPEATAEQHSEPVQRDHCRSPLFAATSCRVCGRKAEPK